MLISYLGEKERKKALSTSKVKVLGKDVVASHKIICAVGMFPFYAFLFAFLYYILIKQYVTQNTFYQFLLTISFFFLWPLYAYSIASFWNFIKCFLSAKTSRCQMSHLPMCVLPEVNFLVQPPPPPIYLVGIPTFV